MASTSSTKQNKNIPRYIAKVKFLAEGQTCTPGDQTNIGAEVISRIKKCLDRANHPNTSQFEAQTALRMSNRLMAQFNVSHADLLASYEGTEDRSHIGGQSTVSILSNTTNNHGVVNETWVVSVIYAMRHFFDCEAYSTTRARSIEWTFYGIAPNTVAAAMSFEMVYNLVNEWARIRKANKNSYRLGVATGLDSIAQEEKDEEKRRAKEQEEADMEVKLQQEQDHRQKDLERLNNSWNEYHEESDNHSQSAPVLDENSLVDDNRGSDRNYNDDSDFEGELEEQQTTFLEEEEMQIDLEADFEEDFNRHVNSQATAWDSQGNQRKRDAFNAKDALNPDEVTSSEIIPAWKSQTALILFREQAKKIAEDFLSAQNIKLRKDRKRHYSIRDFTAFSDGRRDSKKIDVKRRRIDE